MTRTQESMSRRYAGVAPGVFALTFLVVALAVVFANPEARDAFGTVAAGILVLLGIGAAGFAALVGVGLAIRAALVRRRPRS